MIGNRTLISFLVLAGIGSVRVFGFAAERAKNSAISPDKNKAPYYSYKTFQKLGAPAIFYSTIAKISNKVRRVKPKEILASKPATDEKRPKVALVTGSNTGVGFQTAKTLALDHGCQVIIACRSREKGGAACNAINQAIEEDGVGNATFLAPLDLSNLDSVREFCQAVNKQYSTIDVLVNNAGKNTGGEPLTDQNLDDVFTTNFLGHFLLTNLLLEKCKRIVNLSSVMHHFPFYSKDAPYSDVTSKDLWSYAALDDIDSDHDDWNKSLRKPYAPSKLAALLFSIELNRRYQSNNAFRSFAVNPGAVNSEIWRNYPSAMKKLFSKIYLTSEQGSSTSVAASVMDFDDSVIYLQPYWLPNRSGSNGVASCPFPMFEMLGPYFGYQPTEPRLPESLLVQQACDSLFAVCEELSGCQYPAKIASAVDQQ